MTEEEKILANVFPSTNSAYGLDTIDSTKGWVCNTEVGVYVIESTDTEMGGVFSIFVKSLTGENFKCAYFDWNTAQPNTSYTAEIRIKRTGNSNGIITKWEGVENYSDNQNWEVIGNDVWTIVTATFTAVDSLVRLKFYSNGIKGDVSVGDGFEISKIQIIEV